MAFITTSDVINRIKVRIGSLAHVMELSDGDIRKCIRNETLRTLSVFFPRIVDVPVNLTQDEDTEAQDKGTFFIRWSETDILGCEEAVGLGYSYDDGYGRLSRYSGRRSGGVLNQIVDNIAEGLTSPFLPEFIPPNKVLVTPNPVGRRNTFVLTCKVAHSDFSKFNPGLREMIMELAEYDVKMDLLSVRQYFANVQAEFATIELNLGPLEEAVSNRRELLEKIRPKFHLSANRRKVWVF